MVFELQIVFVRYAENVPKAIKQRLTRQESRLETRKGFWSQQLNCLQGAAMRARLSI
jgi:hypothetical protein